MPTDCPSAIIKGFPTPAWKCHSELYRKPNRSITGSNERERPPQGTPSSAGRSALGSETGHSFWVSLSIPAKLRGVRTASSLAFAGCFLQFWLKALLKRNFSVSCKVTAFRNLDDSPESLTKGLNTEFSWETGSFVRSMSSFSCPGHFRWRVLPIPLKTASSFQFPLQSEHS